MIICHVDFDTVEFHNRLFIQGSYWIVLYIGKYFCISDINHRLYTHFLMKPDQFAKLW